MPVPFLPYPACALARHSGRVQGCTLLCLRPPLCFLCGPSAASAARRWPGSHEAPKETRAQGNLEAVQTSAPPTRPTSPAMPARINIPPITRGLLVALLTLSLLSAVIRYRQWSGKDSNIVVPYLNLIPQLSVIYPWTFLLTTLVESNVFTLAISGVTIFYGGRYLERAWSSREFVKFLLIVTLIPNTLCFATLVTLFAVTGSMAWTLTTIGGGIPLEISFLVAFSQLVPAHTVTLFRGIFSLRVPRFPSIFILAVLILTFTPLLTSASLLLSLYGFLVSWTYLRFYKAAYPDLETSQPSSLRGDASETFAFAEFFPNPLRPAVASFSNAIYDVLVSLKICTPFSADNTPAGRSDFMSSRPAQGSSRAETERRRALALKALDQRLNASMTAKAPQPSGQAGPSGREDKQPGPVTQTPMIGKGGEGGLLGETSYVADGESHEKGASQD